MARHLFAAVLALLSGLLLPTAAVTQTVILVRHAEKADDGTRDPPLAPEGRVRAEALANLLAGRPLALILTSPALRTRETAAPVTEATGTPSEAVPIEGRDIDAHIQATAARLRGLKPGDSALVVGHGNTVPAIIAALGGPTLPNLPECAYDRLYTLTLGPTPTLGRGSYGAPGKDCPAD